MYRPGYQESFWDALHGLGVGLKGQRILDLGTGVLARAFAKKGAVATGIDISSEQIEQARALTVKEGLEASYDVCSAEEMDFLPGTFDVVSAGQSWLYFDLPTVIPRVLEAMKPDGLLVLTYLVWLPFENDIAKQTDDLVLKFNPDWKGAHLKAFEP